MMKINNLYPLLVWFILCLSGSCARQGSPTGGPKDTIPPTIVNINPPLGTVNFRGDEIEIEFNEFVEARDLKKELIINPKVDDYKFYVNRRTLVISLEERLEDSTTYTFNFRNAVKDISEQNSAQNVILAFSTGAYLDSLQVAGKVKSLLTQKPAEEVVVGLYNVNDTLDIFNSTPLYFTKTDERGYFQINYIKEGVYYIYAFNDQNDNFKYESNNEAIGFKAQPLYLTTDSVKPMEIPDSLQLDATSGEKEFYGQNVNLELFKKDFRPIQIQSSRSNGKYYEVKFNKPIKSYSIDIQEDSLTKATKSYVEDSLLLTSTDSTKKYVFSNFQEQQQLIRFYNSLKQDSVAVGLHAEDSAGQQIKDTTLYIQFAETRRKKEDLTQQFNTKNPEITDRIRGEVKFSKPIVRVNTDSILLVYDTLFTLPLEYEKFLKWNDHLDQLTIDKKINKKELAERAIAQKLKDDSIAFQRSMQMGRLYTDSLRAAADFEQKRAYFEAIVQHKSNTENKKLLDSLQNINNEEIAQKLLSDFADTVTFDDKYQAAVYDTEQIMAGLKPLVLYMAPGSFMSVEQDSSKEIRQQFTFKNPENYGTIKGRIATQYPSYTIQLLDKNFNVVAETRSHNTYTFQLVPPGNYMIRVLIDKDEDGQWEEGNLLLRKEPEPVIVYDSYDINLKANWEFTLDLEL